MSGHGLCRHINLNTAADPALCPFTAGTFRIRQFIREHDLTNRLHICMWLLKTYAIPAGMYASQVWATPFLRQSKEMDNPLQKWLMTVLKRILMVKDTTPSLCVMRECGLEPLQFNWFWAAVRLYNALTQSNLLSNSMLILCTMLISLFRPDVLLSILPTFKPIRRGLLACLLAILLILTDPPSSILMSGLFFPSGPFSLIDVRSSLLLA